MTREQIAAAALAYRGAPWRHLGRSITGMDCIGLVIAVARDVGAKPADFDLHYDRRPDGTMAGMLREHLRPVSVRRATQGTVVVVATGLAGHHVGIMLDDRRFIHATSGRGVAVDVFDHNWRQRVARVSSAYDFPGVTDG